MASRSFWTFFSGACLSILCATGFVGAQFPQNDSAFHWSQFWESAIVSLGMLLSWTFAYCAGMLCSPRNSGKDPWHQAWAIALLLSLAAGILVAVIFGYRGFTDEARDWGKTHADFVLGDYLCATIGGGIGYGAMASGILMGGASIGLVVAMAVKKVLKKTNSTANAPQQ